MVEIFTDMNKQTEKILPQMAQVYRQEFAKDPWLEVSKCTNDTCIEGMGGCPVGSACSKCGQLLEPVYDVNELIAGWAELLNEGKSWLEVATARSCLHSGYIGA